MDFIKDHQAEVLAATGTALLWAAKTAVNCANTELENGCSIAAGANLGMAAMVGGGAYAAYKLFNNSVQTVSPVNEEQPKNDEPNTIAGRVSQRNRVKRDMQM